MSHETHRLSVRGSMDTPMRERRITWGRGEGETIHVVWTQCALGLMNAFNRESPLSTHPLPAVALVSVQGAPARVLGTTRAGARHSCLRPTPSLLLFLGIMMMLPLIINSYNLVSFHQNLMTLVMN